MSDILRGALPALLLPTFLLVLFALFGGAMALRGRARAAGLLVVLACVAQLLLATPFAAAWLQASLEAGIRLPAGATPAAIVILSAEAAHGQDHLHPGPLSLERLRAGARLQRRTGLPVLVTGGLVRPGDTSLGQILAESLREDFGIETRWIERRSRDTRENALFSAALLRADGIGTVWLVTHGWHMRRAQDAFARAGIVAVAAPVRTDTPPGLGTEDWIPRPDHLAFSWFALREWAGRLVYRWRDGPSGQALP